jgi:hypothetical protein
VSNPTQIFLSVADDSVLPSPPQFFFAVWIRAAIIAVNFISSRNFDGSTKMSQHAARFGRPSMGTCGFALLQSVKDSKVWESSGIPGLGLRKS